MRVRDPDPVSNRIYLTCGYECGEKILQHRLAVMWFSEHAPAVAPNWDSELASWCAPRSPVATT